MTLKRTFKWHPNDLPDIYAMQCEGTCLEPEIPDGSKLLFSSTERYRPKDFVVLFRRPEFVKPGEHQAIVKKLIIAPTPSYWLNGEKSMGDIRPIVLVEMLNPRRTLYYLPDMLLGIHKCLGPVPDDQPTTVVNGDDVFADASRVKEVA